MLAALINSNEHLKFQNLNTTNKNKRGSSDPAMPHSIGPLPGHEDVHYSLLFLFFTPNPYLTDQNSERN